MKLTINNQSFEIIEQGDGDHVYINNPDNEMRIGVTDILNNIIYIHKDLPTLEKKKQTLIHELTHAYIYAYGFSSEEFFNHELICEFLSTYARDIIRTADEYFRKTSMADILVNAVKKQEE